MTSRGGKSSDRYRFMKKIPQEKIYPTRFDGYYVGKDGSVWTHWTHGGYTGPIRRMTQNPRGGVDPEDRYLAVNISLRDAQGKSLKQIKYYSHRLVAETLVENVEGLPEINHKDENKKNNSVSNLEWSDRKTNMDHSRNENGILTGSHKSHDIVFEEYEPVIDHIPENWVAYYKPEKVIAKRPPKFKVVDLYTDEEHNVRSMTTWVNDNWEYISKRCRTKSSKNFYTGLMVAKSKNKPLNGFLVTNI